MRIAVTGTPGTGKTSATERLPDRIHDREIEVVHLNDAIREAELFSEIDDVRDSLVADLDAVENWLDRNATAGEIEVVESHLAHHLPADRVVVLRCHPDELGRRLGERDESAASIAENEESEALDVVLAEAIERHSSKSVFEIDATERTPENVARELGAVVAGEREPSAGTVSFADALADRTEP